MKTKKVKKLKRALSLIQTENIPITNMEEMGKITKTWTTEAMLHNSLIIQDI